MRETCPKFRGPWLVVVLLCCQAWRTGAAQTASIIWATQGPADGFIDARLGSAPSVDQLLSGWYNNSVTSSVVVGAEAQLDSLRMWLALAENPISTPLFIEVWRQDTNELVATSNVTVLSYFSGSYTTNTGFNFTGANRINLVPGVGYGFVIRGTGQGAGTLLVSASQYQGQYDGEYFEIYGVPPQSFMFSVNQEKPDGTGIKEGRGITERLVTFTAILESLSQVDPALLQVELQPFAQPFTGIATLTSGFVASGGPASVTSASLADGQYHWQARTVDINGNASSWQEFGMAGNVDFVVSASIPGIAAYFSDGGFPNGYCGHGTVGVVPDFDLQITTVDFWAICANGVCTPPNDFRIFSADGQTLLAESDGQGSYFGYPLYKEMTQTFSGTNQITLRAGQTYQMTPFSANGGCLVDPYDGTFDTFYLRGVPLYGPVAVSAGQNQNVKVGAPVTLGGSATAAGCTPALLWTWVAKPAASLATLGGASTATPSFVPDVQGMYTLELSGSCGSSSGSATVVVSATDCTGAVLSGYPKNPPALAGQTLSLQGYGGSGSYSWALVQNSSNGSLAASTGASVSYTAGSTAGIDVVQMSDSLCSATLAFQITVTTTDPILVTRIDLAPSPTYGASTVTATAMFSKPANGAKLCIDGTVNCQTTLLAGNDATSATFSIPTSGLAGGEHTVYVQAAGPEGLGPALGKTLTVGTPFVLLLRGYDFPPCDTPQSASASGAVYWRNPLFNNQSPSTRPIECQIQTDFFGSSAACSAGGFTACPDDSQADAPHDHVCVVDTLNGKEGVEANVGALADYIHQRSYLVNAETLILIGHSYGGMIGRAYAACASSSSPCPRNVGAILTLDTPHLGAKPWELELYPVFHLGKEAYALATFEPCQVATWWQDTALPNFSVANARIFNGNYPPGKSPTTRIYPIATRRQYSVVDLPDPTLSSYPQSTIAAVTRTTTYSGSDDIVDLASQEWLPGSDDGSDQLDLRQGGKVQTPQVVSIPPDVAPRLVTNLLLAVLGFGGDVLHTSVVDDPKVWNEVYLGAVKNDLCKELKLAICNAAAGGRRRAATASTAGRDVPLLPDFDLRPVAALNGSLTAATPSASASLSVEAATDLTLSVLTDGADPVVTAQDPSGVVHSALSADNLATQYEISSVGIENRQTLILHRPAPGTWTIQIAASNGGAGPNVSPAGAVWAATAALRSPIRLNVGVPGLSYLVGDSLNVSATLDENGAAVTGAVVVASLTPVAGGAGQTFSLYDDGAHGDGAAGEGVYGGATTLGSAGDFVLTVTASGPSDLGTFQRYQSGAVRVGTPQVTLDGGFVESSPDADGNGLFDSVSWSFAIDVPAAGHYVVFGDLAAPDGTVVASAEAGIDPGGSGRQPVTLVFAGQQIYRGGRPGPYTVENLRVPMETPNGPLLAGRFSTTAVTTGPYWSWMVFERDASPNFTWKTPVVPVATAGSSFTLEWNLADGDGGTTIDLYFDQTGTGFNGTPIVTGLSGVNGATGYTWDISALADGVYHVYALVRNGGTSQALYGGSVQKVTDSDGDGMPDAWETAHGLNPNDPGDAYLDPDGDGLANVEEYRHGTDPQNADTDGGGESDGSEVDNGRDPTNPGDDVRAVSISAVAPQVGDSRGGDQVLILGSGFQSGATVSFGGVPATGATVASSSRVFAITPANGIGQVDVTVSNLAGGGVATQPSGFGFLCEFVEPPAASNNGPLCPGQALQLSATGLAGATYSWSGPNGFTSNSQSPAIPLVTAAASGVYTVTLQAGSCSLTASTSVTISAPAGPVASNSGPTCAGQDVQLEAASVAGATYQWTGPDGYTSSEQNPVLAAAQPAVSGVYGVTATFNGCVSQAATTSVLVRSLPTAVVSGSAQSCAGAPDMIQAALTGTAPWNLTWSDGLNQPAVGTSPATRSVQPSSNTTYTVTGVVDAYCSGTSSGEAAITINPACMRFSTVTPCRVIDTRNPAGPLGGPALQHGAARTFAVAGFCGIPASARAISVNVTITQPTAAGDLRLYPSDASQLPLVSTINWLSGATRANNAVVELSADSSGSFDVRVDGIGSVQFIMDVNGYFE
jgi:IPT/TIG domain/Bacterial TSP3 repeat